MVGAWWARGGRVTGGRVECVQAIITGKITGRINLIATMLIHYPAISGGAFQPCDHGLSRFGNIFILPLV